MKHTSVKSAFSFLSKRMPVDWDISQSDYVGMLMELQDNKGGESIEGLAGFYLYAIRNMDNTGDIENEKSASKAIQSTFFNDLNERNKSMMLPRSNDYIKVWREEHLKYNQTL